MPVLPMLTLNISAPFVSWYGAIVATLSLVIAASLAIRLFLLDRVDVRVRVLGNRSVLPETPSTAGKTFIQIDVANWGRRPITVHSVSFKVRAQDRRLLFKDSMKAGGAEIAEGKSFSCLGPEEGMDFSTLESLEVADVAGRVYSAPLEEARKGWGKARIWRR